MTCQIEYPNPSNYLSKWNFPHRNASYQEPKTCKFCGEGNLHWRAIEGKWQLFSSSGIHNCPINPLKENLEREEMEELYTEKVQSQKLLIAKKDEDQGTFMSSCSVVLEQNLPNNLKEVMSQYISLCHFINHNEEREDSLEFQITNKTTSEGRFYELRTNLMGAWYTKKSFFDGFIAGFVVTHRRDKSEALNILKGHGLLGTTSPSEESTSREQ